MIVLKKDQRSTLTVLMLKIQERIELNHIECCILNAILNFCFKKESDIFIKAKLLCLKEYSNFNYKIDHDEAKQFLLAYLTGLEITSAR